MARQKSTELKKGISPALAAATDLVPADGTTLRKFVSNNSVYYGRDYDELISLLEKRENENTSRAVVAGESLEVVEMTDEVYQALVSAGYPLDILTDSKAEGLVLKNGRKYYPLMPTGEAALHRIANGAWDELPRELRASVYNATLGVKNIGGERHGLTKEYTVVAQDARILSVLSRVYTPYPPCDVFRAVHNEVKALYPEAEMTAAYFDHVNYEMTISLRGEEAKNIKEILVEQLKERSARIGVSFDPNKADLTLSVVARTGETGNDTVSICSKIGLGGNVLSGILLGDDVAIYHKGEADVRSLVKKKVANIYATFQDTIQTLIKSADVKILDWRGTIANLANEYRLPDDVWKKMLVDFEVEHRGMSVVSAFDILQAFMASTELFAVQNPNATETQRDNYNNKVKCVIACDITRFDNDEARIKAELVNVPIISPEVCIENVAKELKTPVAVKKRILEEYHTNVALYTCANNGNPMPTTAFDIYTLFVNSKVHMRNWFVEKKQLEGSDLEQRMAVYEKSLAKAKKVSYVQHDRDTAVA